MNDNREYEMITMATEESLDKLVKIVPYYHKNLHPKIIYVISPSQIRKKIEKIDRVIFIDESKVYPGLDKKVVEDIIYGICGERKRAGWYLQQFLKMAWALKTEEPYYIEMDSDTFPLNEIPFIDENGRYLLTGKKEYNQPYFDTLNKLFNGDIKREDRDVSYVAEHMIFDTRVMREIIIKIENNNRIKGEKFYEKILYAIDKKDLIGSGFSEFETYGNYMKKYYKEQFRITKLKTLREAVCLLGVAPLQEQLEWAKRDYDIISIEGIWYPKRLIPMMTKSRIFRKMFHMKTIANMRQKTRSLYRRFLHREDFRFE